MGRVNRHDVGAAEPEYYGFRVWYGVYVLRGLLATSFVREVATNARAVGGRVYVATAVGGFVARTRSPRDLDPDERPDRAEIVYVLRGAT